MWYDCLERTEFLRKLYKEIPSLDDVDVRIESLVISDEGSRVTICFDMPHYADFPPEKWSGSNTAFVELDFFGITKLEFSTTSSRYRGKIVIAKNAEGLLKVGIRGNLNLDILADCGLLQHVKAYLQE